MDISVNGQLRQRCCLLDSSLAGKRGGMNENMGCELKAAADQDGDAMEFNPDQPVEHLKPYICKLE